MTLLTVLSLKLQVTQAQIKKCLALAPVYTLSIIFVSLLLYILIQNAFDFTAIYEIITIFLFYLIIIFILYFVFIYVFIYALQRLLVKLNRLNFWFIMLCAIVLTLIFSFSIFLLGSIDFSIFLIVGLFSIPIALMYWILLFSQHQKNHKS